MRMVRPDEPSKSRSDACGTLFWLREMSRYRTFEVSAVGRPTAQKRSESRLLPSPRRIVLLAGPHSAIVSASPPSKCGGARLRGGPSSRLCLFGLRRLRRPMRLQPMSVSRTAVWRTSGSGRSRCRVARGAGSPEVPGRSRCRRVVSCGCAFTGGRRRASARRRATGTRAGRRAARPGFVIFASASASADQLTVQMGPTHQHSTSLGECSLVDLLAVGE